MNTSGPRVCIVGKFLIIHLIPLAVIGFFKLKKNFVLGVIICVFKGICIFYLRCQMYLLESVAVILDFLRSTVCVACTVFLGQSRD